MTKVTIETKVHVLKTWNPFFDRVWLGQKNFEVRKHDRDYQVGDTLLLKEYDPEKDSYNRQIHAEVTYLLTGGQFGIEEGYCVMGIRVL